MNLPALKENLGMRKEYTDHHFMNMRDSVNYKVIVGLISEKRKCENQNFLWPIGLVLVP